MRIKQNQVPIAIRRMAAQHLESLRGTKLGYNVDDLYLGEDVCPIYRPDMKEPAYYEFEVHKDTRKEPDARADLVPGVAKTNVLGNDGYLKIYRDSAFPIKVIGADLLTRLQSPVQGFITVSASENDFPIPHWSLDHLPVSVHLENESKKLKKNIKKIYKLDALAYLGEDENGNEISSIGQKPAIIKNMPVNLAAFAGKINSVVPKTLKTSRAPDVAKMRGEAYLKKGPKQPALSFDKFPSWGTLKKDYVKSFKPMLEALRDKAGPSWKVEHSIRELGEGIKVGTPSYVLLLEKDFAVNVTGEASDMVKVRIVKRPNGNAAIELLCENQSITRETEFKLHIKYGSKNEERLDFFIYKPEIPTNEKSNLGEE